MKTLETTKRPALWDTAEFDIDLEEVLIRMKGEYDILPYEAFQLARKDPEVLTDFLNLFASDQVYSGIELAAIVAHNFLKRYAGARTVTA